MAAQRQCPTPFELVDRVDQHLKERPARELLTKIRDVIEGGIRKCLNKHNKPDMTGLLGVFGILFFGNSLRNVTIRWDDRLIGSDCAFGSTRTERDGDQAILLDPQPFVPGDGEKEEELFGGSTADSVLSTMLHEEVHAYLRSEGCLEGKCGREECREAWHEQVGDGGHGPAFCRLAILIERHARRLELWNCKLEVAEQAKTHRKDTGRMLDFETQRRCFGSTDGR